MAISTGAAILGAAGIGAASRIMGGGGDKDRATTTRTQQATLPPASEVERDIVERLWGMARETLGEPETFKRPSISEARAFSQAMQSAATHYVKPDVEEFQEDIERYMEGVRGIEEKYGEKADEVWRDWQEFEKKYDDLSTVIAAEYGDIRDTYERELREIPEMAVGLPGGGRIPLAPKQHSGILAQQAATRGGFLGAETGGLLSALAGRGAGLGARQALAGAQLQGTLGALGASLNPMQTILKAMTPVSTSGASSMSEKASTAIGPQGLSSWEGAQAILMHLLASERALRAGQAGTVMQQQQPEPDVLGTVLPAVATAIPMMTGSPEAGIPSGLVGTDLSPFF